MQGYLKVGLSVGLRDGADDGRCFQLLDEGMSHHIFTFKCAMMVCEQLCSLLTNCARTQYLTIKYGSTVLKSPGTLPAHGCDCRRKR